MKRNSDANIRTEERTWRESGSDSDAARFAAAWIRAGKPEGELVVKLVKGGANLAVVSAITEIPGLDPDAPSDEVIRALWDVLKIDMLDYPDTEEDLVQAGGDLIEPIEQLENPITTVEGFIRWIDELADIADGSTGIDTGRRDFTTDEGEWIKIETRGDTALLPDSVLSPTALGIPVGETVDIQELKKENPERADEILEALSDYVSSTDDVYYVEALKGWGSTFTSDHHDWLAPYDTEKEAEDALFENDDETLSEEDVTEKRKKAGEIRTKLLSQIGLAPPASSEQDGEE